MPTDKYDAELTCKAVVGVEQVLPHLDQGQWKAVELSADEWNGLEDALQLPLDSEQREATSDAIGYFIHTLRLKDRIPTPRQYAQQISTRLAEIIETTENLLTQITPFGEKPTNIRKVSTKTAQKIFGGRMATWRASSNASRTTEAGEEVMAPEDHVRYLIAHSYPKMHNDAHTALIDLARGLHALQKGISTLPHNKAGPDGNYELNLFLADLLRVARAAGDDLRLAPHDIRDAVMADTVKPKPAYRFVERVVSIVLESAEGLVEAMELPPDDRAKLLERVKANLDRKPGTLIDPLEAARAVVGGRRE